MKNKHFANIRIVMCALFCFFIASPVMSGVIPADQFFFSLDSASPTAGGGEVLTAGPTTEWSLASGQNINALSQGLDLGITFNKYAPRSGPLIYFSLDRGSLEHPADIYGAFWREGVANEIIHDHTVLGLGDNDNIDALASFDPRYKYNSPFYISTTGSADIQVVNLGDGTSSVFASAVNLGLGTGDDLDALAFWDDGVRGVLEPGLDLAVFSLERDSSSLASLTVDTQYPLVEATRFASAADLLMTDFQGNFWIWANAEEMGLDPAVDNIDALSSPEPGSLLLLGSGLAGLGYCRRRKKREA